jgi:hypothetical protein
MRLVDLHVAQKGIAPSKSRGEEEEATEEVGSDDDWDTEDQWEAPPTTTAAPTARKVRAIYDYHAEDEEELNLKVGDIIVEVSSRMPCSGRGPGFPGHAMLILRGDFPYAARSPKQMDPEDEQGWCKGVHMSSGKTGIYPALYVEAASEAQVAAAEDGYEHPSAEDTSLAHSDTDYGNFNGDSTEDDAARMRLESTYEYTDREQDV